MIDKKLWLKPAFALVLAGSLVACAGNNGNNVSPAPSSSAPTSEGASASATDSASNGVTNWKVGDNVSLKWYLNFGWWDYNKKWLEYPVLKEVSDITGVVPEVSIPTGDGTEKVNLMIATNTLPDLVTMDQNDPSVQKLISQGLVYSYDELIEQYAPELKNEIPTDVWNYSKADDGKLYGLPSFFLPQWQYDEKYGVGANAYNVRKDIYEELGKPDMTTPDGLYNALKAFKEKYPTINGKASIPMTLYENAGYTFMIERSFGLESYYVDGDQIQHNFKDPRYLEVVKYLNKLAREGLLDPEMYIKKVDQINEDMASGRIFSAPHNNVNLVNSVNASLEQAKSGSGFIAVEPMKNQAEVKLPGYNRLGWTTTMVTKQAKDPEAAIKFIRYMWSKEGNTLVNYGHEGVDYTIENGWLKQSPAVLEESTKDPHGWSERTGIFTFRLFNYSYYKVEWPGSPEQVANRELADKYAFDNTLMTFKMSPDPTSPEGIINTQVNELMKNEFPKVVLADSEEKAVSTFQALIDKMDKVGLPKLEAYWTDRYNKNVAKFTGE
ncbi:extracellular solute-binding protein [Paenibacillaceae bacterium WGS1546]|uniref:extracellular solute-binding protein n=1 Tax=Cohnella sp. WGS1546 TaxID=3366810 RepID=UPI00372D1F4D